MFFFFPNTKIEIKNYEIIYYNVPWLKTTTHIFVVQFYLYNLRIFAGQVKNRTPGVTFFFFNIEPRLRSANEDIKVIVHPATYD